MANVRISNVRLMAVKNKGVITKLGNRYHSRAFLWSLNSNDVALYRRHQNANRQEMISLDADRGSNATVG